MNGNTSMLCATRGPITLITLGVLFALNNFTPYGFSETWPVLLIVFGALSLLCRGARTGGPQAPYGYPQQGYPQQGGYPPPGGFPPPPHPEDPSRRPTGEGR